MKFAILSYEYPPETGFGGIGTYSFYQARALVKLGHQVRVIAGSTRTGLHRSEHDGVQVTRIKREGWLSRLLEDVQAREWWWLTNRLAGAANAYGALRHEMEREHFDFVEMPECGADGLVVATLLPLPTAIKFHSPARLIMGMYQVRRADRELTSLVEQMAINQADVLTSCSQFLADEVREKMGVRRPVEVIPNGIDLELFDRDDGIDVREKFGLPTDGILIFFANRIEERKGSHLVHEMVFHLLERYQDVHFVMAGEDGFGYMENDILPKIEEKDFSSRFHYLGKLDLAEVRAVLKATSIFLIPSLWENCPYSCIEAMAAGRAIVSSDCGGMPELIADEVNGLLARNDDSQSFIAALERMIEDPELRRTLGSKARETVEERLTDVAIARRAAAFYEAHLNATKG